MLIEAKKYYNYIKSKYNKEFNFLISLLRSDTDILKPIDDFNWDEFIRLTDYHKLYPVLFSGAILENKITPKDIEDKLKTYYEEKSKVNLHITSQLIWLNYLLDENGIKRLWLKGPVLAIILYGQLNQRLSGDIDLLINYEDIVKVNQILINDGFTCELDLVRLKPGVRKFFQKYRNQLHYYNKQKRIAVELHWRLVNPNGLWRITFNELYKNSVEIEVGNMPMRTLSTDHYFIYLSAHGTLHKWFRLFWLRDIHEMLIQNKVNWKEAIQIARDNKILPIISESLIVSQLFFNSTIPDELLKIKANNKANKLTGKIIKAINQPASAFQSKGIGHLKSIFYLSQLKNDLRYKMNCFIKLFINSEELKTFTLPAIFLPIYCFKRFFSWFRIQYLKK